MTQELKSPVTPEELELALRDLLALLGGTDGTSPQPPNVNLVEAKQRAVRILDARDAERITMIAKRRGLSLGD